MLARSPYKPVDPKIAKLAETRGGSGLYNVCIGGRAFSLTLCCRAAFALPRPSEATLSPLPPALAYLPHNTQRYEHPQLRRRRSWAFSRAGDMPNGALSESARKLDSCY